MLIFQNKIKNFILKSQASFAYNLFIGALALISTGLLAYEFLNPDLMADKIEQLRRADLYIAWIFLADFFAGFYAINFSLNYIRKNWLNALASIPLSEGLFRALRILRFFKASRVVFSVSQLRELIIKAVNNRNL